MKNERQQQKGKKKRREKERRRIEGNPRKGGKLFKFTHHYIVWYIYRQCFAFWFDCEYCRVNIPFGGDQQQNNLLDYMSNSNTGKLLIFQYHDYSLNQYRFVHRMCAAVMEFGRNDSSGA